MTHIRKPPPLAARLQKALPSRRGKWDGLLHVNPYVHGKGDRHERVAEPLPREMVLQVPRGDRPEISEAGDLWEVAEGDWGHPASVVRTGGGRVGGGGRGAGPRAPGAAH